MNPTQSANKCPVYDTKTYDGEAPHLEVLG